MCTCVCPCGAWADLPFPDEDGPTFTYECSGNPGAESLQSWMCDYRFKASLELPGRSPLPSPILRRVWTTFPYWVSLSPQSSWALPRRSMSTSRTQMGELSAWAGAECMG